MKLHDDEGVSFVGNIYSIRSTTDYILVGTLQLFLAISLGRLNRKSIFELRHETCHLILQELELLNGSALEIFIQ